MKEAAPSSPAEPLKIVTAETIAELISRAAASPRKRMNFNLHNSTDSICRFLNAGIAGTYVRPHRHQIDKWELVSVIQGQCDLLIFTSDGVVKDRIALGFGGTGVAEIPGGSWHSVVFRAPGRRLTGSASAPSWLSPASRRGARSEIISRRRSGGHASFTSSVRTAMSPEPF